MPQEHDPLSSTDGSTPTPALAGQGVNTAQTNPTPSSSPHPQSLDTSGLIASYEQRISRLMSEKDKMAHERNQAIAQLSTLQVDHTSLQEQTQGSLTAAANAAQQAIDHAKRLETELVSERARNAKLTALMQRPHLAPYADLIPAKSDEAELKAVLDQLEQIRQQDLDRHRSASPAPAGQPQATEQTPNQILQSLYGNRANMHPNAFGQPAIPASSPAMMNPNATQDASQSIQALFDDARRTGTKEAFDQALAKANLLAQSALPAR